MRKIVSVMAAVGMVAALTASAFAAEPSAALNGIPLLKTGEVGITDLGDGVDAMATVKDVVVDSSEVIDTGLGDVAENLDPYATVKDVVKDAR